MTQRKSYITLQGFYRVLRNATKKQGLKWRITHGGSIRSRHYCPIELCDPGIDRWLFLSAARLGLHPKNIDVIIMASDNKLKCLKESDEKVRRNLLRACGLEGRRNA